MHQIEYEYKDRGYNNYELYLNKSQKNLEEIKDISSNDSYSSRSGYSQNFIPSKKFSDFLQKNLQFKFFCIKMNKKDNYQLITLFYEFKKNIY